MFFHSIAIGVFKKRLLFYDSKTHMPNEYIFRSNNVSSAYKTAVVTIFIHRPHLVFLLSRTILRLQFNKFRYFFEQIKEER